MHGQAAIAALLAEVAPGVGAVVFEPLGPRSFDGTTSVQEWQQMAVLPDGNRVMLLRGTSVRRFVDGWAVYSADYFDTAALDDDEVREAAREQRASAQFVVNSNAGSSSSVLIRCTNVATSQPSTMR